MNNLDYNESCSNHSRLNAERTRNLTLTIQKADKDLRPRALSILFHDLPPQERTAQIDQVLSAEQEKQLHLDGLYIAQQNGHDIAACLTLWQPDNSVVLWPPVLPDPELAEALAGQFIQQLTQKIKSAGAIYIQAILEIDEEQSRTLLEQNGFLHLTELIFMERKIKMDAHSLRDAPAEQTRWTTRSLAAGTPRNLFTETLEKTYIETKDVPEFTYFRTGDEAFHSHQVTGPFQPALWTLFFSEDQPAGILILRNYTEEKRWELAYMGVVPEYRGKGLGTDIIQYALKQAQQADCRLMTLAVDVQNSYAIKRYNESGFQTTDTKSVLICK